MKILAIDTSTMSSSIALMDQGEILGEMTINQEKTHSETLVPMISFLLDKLGMDVNEIDRFAIGIGPGSFTGLRIGMTIGKTLAQVNHADLVGVSTLEALARNVRAQTYIVSLLDARGGRTYYGLFKCDGEKYERVLEDDLSYVEDLVDELKHYQPIQVVGDYTNESKEILSPICTFSPETYNSIIARNIAYLAQDRRCTPMYDLKPNYVRKSQAQRDREKGK